jgi:hypothetical protein
LHVICCSRSTPILVCLSCLCIPLLRSSRVFRVHYGLRGMQPIQHSLSVSWCHAQSTRCWHSAAQC